MEDISEMEEWTCCVSCRREIKDEAAARCPSCLKEDPEVVTLARSTAWDRVKGIFKDTNMRDFDAEDTENIEEDMNLDGLFDDINGQFDIGSSLIDNNDLDNRDQVPESPLIPPPSCTARSKTRADTLSPNALSAVSTAYRLSPIPWSQEHQTLSGNPSLATDQQNGHKADLLEREGHGSIRMAACMQTESQPNEQQQQLQALVRGAAEHHGTGQISPFCLSPIVIVAATAQTDNQRGEGDGDHSLEGNQAASHNCPLHLSDTEEVDDEERTIPNFHVVLGHQSQTPTLATELWRIVRQKFAKKKISDSTLMKLKAELREKLESEMQEPLPHNPIFWYSIKRSGKLIDPESTDTRILKGDANETKYGKASDKAIKEDVQGAPKQSRTKTVFKFQGSPGSVLGQAETKLEAWIGEDPTKTAVVQKHGGLSRLVQRFNEYTAKKQQCEQEELSHLTKLIYQAELEQTKKRFASEATNLANDMVECYRRVKLKLAESSQRREDSGGGTGASSET